MPERLGDGFSELLPRPGLADPDRRSEPSRLDEDRTAKFGYNSVESRRVAMAETAEARDRQAAVAHQPLGDILVHRRGRAEHARADIRDAGDLGQALDRSVLAERPMQNREDDVDRT